MMTRNQKARMTREKEAKEREGAGLVGSGGGEGKEYSFVLLYTLRSLVVWTSGREVLLLPSSSFPLATAFASIEALRSL